MQHHASVLQGNTCESKTALKLVEAFNCPMALQPIVEEKVVQRSVFPRNSLRQRKLTTKLTNGRIIRVLQKYQIKHFMLYILLHLPNPPPPAFYLSQTYKLYGFISDLENFREAFKENHSRKRPDITCQRRSTRQQGGGREALKELCPTQNERVNRKKFSYKEII